LPKWKPPSDSNQDILSKLINLRSRSVSMETSLNCTSMNSHGSIMSGLNSRTKKHGWTGGAFFMAYHDGNPRTSKPTNFITFQRLQNQPMQGGISSLWGGRSDRLVVQFKWVAGPLKDNLNPVHQGWWDVTCQKIYMILFLLCRIPLQLVIFNIYIY